MAERKLSHLQLQIKEAVSTKPAKLSDLFRDRATIKGLIIVLGLYAGQQLCGVFPMVIISHILIIKLPYLKKRNKILFIKY